MSQQGQQGNVFIGPFTVTIEHFKTDHCIRNSFFSGQALKGSPNLLLLCHSIGCRVLGAKFYHVGFYKNIIIAKQRKIPFIFKPETTVRSFCHIVAVSADKSVAAALHI